jgi:hypothetical protein
MHISWQEPLQGNYGMQVPGESIDLLMRRGSSDEQKGALAFAAPFASTGVRVTIFYDRVALLLSPSAPAAAAILGCVLAHEIAHVLLETNGHSESGLMRAHWTADDFAQIARGSLVFTPDDTELIRQNMRVSQINRACGVRRPPGCP